MGKAARIPSGAAKIPGEGFLRGSVFPKSFRAGGGGGGNLVSPRRSSPPGDGPQEMSVQFFPFPAPNRTQRIFVCGMIREVESSQSSVVRGNAAGWGAPDGVIRRATRYLLPRLTAQGAVVRDLRAPL